MLPSTTQLLTENVGIRDIRDINLTDVLGRNQLDTDIDAIAGYLTGRRVLVTGAGGSIGSELCRQIHRFAPAELMMLDRDESALHAVQLSIHGRRVLDSDDVVLCDIRDARPSPTSSRNRRPEVVFHAAALKHLPMLEQYPAEAVKTNVIGTHNVLEAARLARVERFVNISTDKAANPASVLGYSKRIAEGLTAGHASKVEGTNLRSASATCWAAAARCSTSFAEQIADGGPVTVTDPDVTRYFMTIEEACQLVIQAGAIGRAGEALVLDMGEPVRIVDVARQLIGQAGRRVPVVYTGLRPGRSSTRSCSATTSRRTSAPSTRWSPTCRCPGSPRPRSCSCRPTATPTTYAGRSRRCARPWTSTAGSTASRRRPRALRPRPRARSRWPRASRGRARCAAAAARPPCRRSSPRC